MKPLVVKVQSLRHRGGAVVRRAAAGLLALVVDLAGCATNPPDKTPAASLAATTWELVAIQSMEDSQGTTSVAVPEQYTVSFAADGRVAFRLDCNRATATWQSAPSADGSGGRLEFGPVASTRAMCAPPHLDQRVMRDLPHVRSYLFKDGKLFMSLLADGGIYEWRPRSK